MIEGIIYRSRTGIAWRDLPREFGPWQTVWKRHHRFSLDGTWDKIHPRLLPEADAAGDIDWAVSVDSTINRAHQHATTPARDTGGAVESHEPRSSSRLTMRSAAPAAACRPRSTTPATAPAARW